MYYYFKNTCILNRIIFRIYQIGMLVQTIFHVVIASNSNHAFNLSVYYLHDQNAGSGFTRFFLLEFLVGCGWADLMTCASMHSPPSRSRSSGVSKRFNTSPSNMNLKYRHFTLSKCTATFKVRRKSNSRFCLLKLKKDILPMGNLNLHK